MVVDFGWWALFARGKWWTLCVHMCPDDCTLNTKEVCTMCQNVFWRGQLKGRGSVGWQAVSPDVNGAIHWCSLEWHELATPGVRHWLPFYFKLGFVFFDGFSTSVYVLTKVWVLLLAGGDCSGPSEVLKLYVPFSSFYSFHKGVVNHQTPVQLVLDKVLLE